MLNPSNSNSLAPFLAKTYEMVDDPSTNSMVSWSQNDRSFIVWNPSEFSIHLLPKYFKHSNFSSFIRQLNTYGFRKIDPEKWEFANDEFVRGKPNLLTKIQRRKPVHSHSLQNQDSSFPLNEDERLVYEEKIENLKQGNRLLLLELQKYKHERREIDLEMEALTETYIRLEFSQRNIMSEQSLSGLIQERKRSNGCFNEEGLKTSSYPSRERLERLESWVSTWEEIASDVMSFETDSPPGSDTLFYSVSKMSEIDMNVEPTGAATSEEPVVRTTVNDVFWAQFLTENPIIIESEKEI